MATQNVEKISNTGGIGDVLKLLPSLFGSKQTTTGGDLGPLQQMYQTLYNQQTPAGSNALIQQIFKQGIEGNMPALFNRSNTAGLRTNNSTSQLMANDLQARLSGQAAQAVQQTQQQAMQAAAAIAQNSGRTTTTPGVFGDNPLMGIAASVIGNKVMQSGGIDSIMNAIGLGKTGEVAAGAIPQLLTKGSNLAGGGLTSIAGSASNALKSTSDIIDEVIGGIGGVGDAAGMADAFGSLGGLGDAIGGSLGSIGSSLASGASSGLGTAFGDIGSSLLGSVAGDSSLGSIGDALGIGSMMGDVPVLGPVLSLAEGNAGAAIGSVIGSFLPIPGGSFIGSIIGDAIGGGCYITTAVMAARGDSDDNAYELQTLRDWRDTYLAHQPGGKELILQYYEQAPKAVEALAKIPEAPQVYDHLYRHFIVPAVVAIENGNNSAAFDTYTRMLETVNDVLENV